MATTKSEVNKVGLAKQISQEISDYLTKTINLNESYQYSQQDLVERIEMFESRYYPTGKFDSQENYKYWFDIIGPRIDAEVKNIDFDSKDIEAWSERKIDELPLLITNLKLREWLRVKGKASKINSDIEQGAGWGNVVWKEIKKNYESVDLRNFYVINQTAETLEESPCIERHVLSQSQLLAKAKEYGGTYNGISDILNMGTNMYSETIQATDNDTTVPYYEVYERNGEVKLSLLKQCLDEPEEVEEGDDQKYVLAKVIGFGKSSSAGGVDIEKILFAKKIKEMPYREFHRGRYKGKWMREGIYELLFDLQVRANEVGNQLARGLEWASKIIFADGDGDTIAQNLVTDMLNGDVLNSDSIKQIQVRLQGFDQLVNEWNRIQAEADRLTNATEVVRGETQPANTPFRLTERLNINANKLYDFIREKLSIPLREMFEEWIIPELVAELKTKDILRLTGDSDILDRIKQLAVDDWYLRNLIAIGPHTQETAELLKQQQLEKISNSDELLQRNIKKIFKDFSPMASVIITGENASKDKRLESLATFIQLETDPVRRTHLIEKAMKLDGMDVGSLPKSDPEELQQGGPVSGSRELERLLAAATGGQSPGQVPQED